MSLRSSLTTEFSDEKIINKRNRNSDSCYINIELVDTGALELLFPL